MVHIENDIILFVLIQFVVLGRFFTKRTEYESKNRKKDKIKARISI